jgi:hypothetical protein
MIVTEHVTLRKAEEVEGNIVFFFFLCRWRPVVVDWRTSCFLFVLCRDIGRVEIVLESSGMCAGRESGCDE